MSFNIKERLSTGSKVGVLSVWIILITLGFIFNSGLSKASERRIELSEKTAIVDDFNLTGQQ